MLPYSFLSFGHETSLASQNIFLFTRSVFERAFRLQYLRQKEHADSAISNSVVSVKFDPPV